jgi:Arc/MetJ family transcription regulator
MRTNIEIDDQLMAEAMEISGARTKRDAVEQGLRKLVEAGQVATLLDLWGTGWDGDLDEMRTNRPVIAE